MKKQWLEQPGVLKEAFSELKCTKATGPSQLENHTAIASC